MPLRFLTATLVVTAVAGTVTAQSGEFYGRTPVGPDFDVMTVRNSDGNRLNIHSRVDEADGFYVICMATSGAPHEDNEELMSYQLIELNGQVIMRGTDWAPHFRNANGRQAVCQKTRARIVPNPRFETRWARHDF